MSDEKIVPIRPVILNEVPANVQDQMKNENRDDILDAMDRFRSKVQTCELDGLIMIGFGEVEDDDIIYQSGKTIESILRSIGSLEFVKQSYIDTRLRELEELED